MADIPASVSHYPDSLLIISIEFVRETHPPKLQHNRRRRAVYPRNSSLELDVTKTRYLDNDIIEILEDFSEKAKRKQIDIKLVSVRGVVKNPESFIQFFQLRPQIV